ncbi:Global transcription regulator sge1 [Coemansia erecta]|uniref:Global transcription regulator sge1 n=1 Tax=Coemansia erecta TaxID=147472 RepID=A0A9W7XUQ1_9FUNG|nr:Global transcription regulator sge1 [Coemansia erecta]
MVFAAAAAAAGFRRGNASYSALQADESVPLEIDPRMVIKSVVQAPAEVIIGGKDACFTVTGLHILNTKDALAVFEACRQGILPRVIRRLSEAEKKQIDDGTVIVFDEKEAKMKRWTDGRLWTPSRILGNFLVYRELEKKIQPNQEGAAELAKWQAKEKSPGVYGSNKGVFYPKEHGLIKRTISLAVPDDEEGYFEHINDKGIGHGSAKMPRVHQQHLVAYYHAETSFRTLTPDNIDELKLLRLPLPLLGIQRFRRPVKIEVSEDNQYDIHNSDAEEDMDESGRRIYKPGILTMAGLPGLAAPPSPQTDLLRTIMTPAMVSLPFGFSPSSASSVPPPTTQLGSLPHALPLAHSAHGYPSTVHPSVIDGSQYHDVTPSNLHARIAVQPMPLHKPSVINPNVINPNAMLAPASAYGPEISNYHSNVYTNGEGSGVHLGGSQRQQQPLDQNYSFGHHAPAALGSAGNDAMYSTHTALQLNHPQPPSPLMMISADAAHYGHNPPAMHTQMSSQMPAYMSELYNPLQTISSSSSSGNFDLMQHQDSAYESQHSQSAHTHTDRK